MCCLAMIIKPDRMAQDLIMHIRQNGGSLSKRRRTGEFEKLRDDEVQQIEAIVADAFQDFDNSYSTEP